jgi:TonB family protein
MLRRVWPALLLFVLPLEILAADTPSARLQSLSLEQRELQLAHTLNRASQFVDVPHASARPDCQSIEPPEPLATPNPLPAPSSQGRPVKVSFIIGTDGKVHSPLILESAGTLGDRHVLDTVRTWRYRPATCNGVPTETEGKIEFSSR